MPKGVLTAICMVLVPFRKNKVPVRGGVPGNASKTMQNTAKTAKRRADDGPTLPEKLDKDSSREPQNTRFFLLLGMGTPLGSTLNIA